MAFNTHFFLLISFSILVSFSVQAKRTLPVLDTAPGTPSSSRKPDASAPPPVLSKLSNIISSAISPTPPEGSNTKISFAHNGSPSLAPSPSDNMEYEEALDYHGSNTAIEFQNKITPVVQKIVNEVKMKTSAIIQATIQKGLSDSKRSETEKKCIGACKLDYMDMRNDITEVLHDFSMTHNFEMVNDYLHGLSYDVQTCKNCRAELSLVDNAEYNKFEEWLTSMGRVSAEELHKTMHT